MKINNPVLKPDDICDFLYKNCNYENAMEYIKIIESYGFEGQYGKWSRERVTNYLRTLKPVQLREIYEKLQQIR